jgi:hypothetical protein
MPVYFLLALSSYPERANTSTSILLSLPGCNAVYIGNYRRFGSNGALIFRVKLSTTGTTLTTSYDPKSRG